jgi:hypothetical protein
MKILYFTLLFLLVASLMGLEIMASRVPDQPITPLRSRDSAPPAASVSGR